MGEKTAISWAHHTFNPWRGCSHALFPPGAANAGEEHPGCGGCYAEFLLTEKFRMGGVKGEWGPGAPRTVAAESGWKEPLRWARAAAEAGERRRVFFSLGDPLDEEAPVDAQQRFWQLIRETADLRHGADLDLPMGGLDWLLLTKRPWRWELIPEDVRPLVWLGTSISDQATADVRVPALLGARGFRLLFLSAEPLLGPLDVASITLAGGAQAKPLCGLTWELGPRGYSIYQPKGPSIGWVIAGGESGASRRPAEVAWFQALAEQCTAASVPFFMKQDTAFRAGQQRRIPDELWARKEVPGEAHRAS